MRDDFQDYLPDPSSQRSVTDWLMQVISGKKSIETHVVPRQEETTRAVAVAEMPNEAEAAKAGPQDAPRAIPAAEAPFTAEDLCGPAVFKPSATASASSHDEITADDLCFVPKAQQNGHGTIEETVPFQQNGFAQSNGNGYAPVADASAHSQNGNAVTAADITRDTVLHANEGTQVLFAPRQIETASPEVHEISAADITRDSILRELESSVQNAMEASAAVAQPTSVAEPEAVAAAEANPVEEIAQPEAAPTEIAAVAETDPVGTAPTAEELSVAEEGLAASEATIESRAQSAETQAKTTSTASTTELPEVKLEPDELKQSMFARQGIWGDAARENGATAEDQSAAPEEYSQEETAYREQEVESKREYLRPEDLREIEEMKPSAWKALLKLGAVLPGLARTGSSEGAANGTGIGLVTEGSPEVAHLRMVQYEIRSTVHDHSLQLKRMEEQLTRVREAMESESTENAELTESVRSTVKLVRLIGMGLGALIIVLIVMVGLVLSHH